MKTKVFLIPILVAALSLRTPIAFAEEENDEQHETSDAGAVTLSPDAIKSSQIEVEEAKPATIQVKLKVSGRIVPVSSRVAHITSRYPGVIREVKKDLGDEVKVGDVLALVESNQTLQPFEVRTQNAGLITEREATVGEFASESSALFVVMDLSELWADFTIFQRDISKIKLEQEIAISLSSESNPIKSKIHFISPLVDETTQARIARALIANTGSSLAPGAFVTGEISVGEYQVPLAVSYEGIQTIEGKPTVFVQEGEKFEKREITIGRSDGLFTEVLAGLKEGEKYVSKNSFILKAELGKSEAKEED